jgi:hypothetical protein
VSKTVRDVSEQRKKKEEESSPFVHKNKPAITSKIHYPRGPSVSRPRLEKIDMSDKLSSPSLSSGTSNGLSPRSRTSTASGDESYLVIRKQPPTYAYSNETYDVEVALDAPKNATAPTVGPNPVPIALTLHDTRTGRTCGDETIHDSKRFADSARHWS